MELLNMKIAIGCWYPGWLQWNSLLNQGYYCLFRESNILNWTEKILRI